MKKMNYGLIAFASGLLLLVVQFLVFVFQYINGDIGEGVIITTSADEITFKGFFSDYWWGLAGMLLLIILFVRRMTRGPEAMLTLAGVLLWIVQILSLHESEPLLSFILTYLIGIIGIILVGIAGLYDAYLIKSVSSDDTEKKP